MWSSHFGAALGLPLIRPYVDRGWKVTVFCPDGEFVPQVVAAGIEHVPISISRGFLAPGSDARGMSSLVAQLRRRRFDIVHTHNIKVGWLARIAARLGTGAGIVHTVHGKAFGDNASWAARAVEAAAERTAAAFCDRILVQSNDDADSLIDAGVPARKIVFIGNGVDLARFDPDRVDSASSRTALDISDEHVLFVSAGRLVRDKGFAELASAAARARKRAPNIRVAIAGPVDTLSRQALTDSELDDIGQHARLLGQRNDMPEVIAAADVVALVSHHEGLPRILIEGAAMAKPLVATDARGCREVLNDSRSGTLIPVGDVDALTNAMIDLASDPQRRRQCARFNREMAQSRFDIEAVRARLDRVYAEFVR